MSLRLPTVAPDQDYHYMYEKISKIVMLTYFQSKKCILKNSYNGMSFKMTGKRIYNNGFNPYHNKTKIKIFAVVLKSFLS